MQVTLRSQVAMMEMMVLKRLGKLVGCVALIATLVAVGCDSADTDPHAAPRDVEDQVDGADAMDAAATADAVDVQSDAGDSVGGGDADAGVADVKNCPPGTQIAGCPCDQNVAEVKYGCCLGSSRGLACSALPPDHTDYRWFEVVDCCTPKEPWCGEMPPGGGWAPLCLSKPLP